jgi:TolB-like protein/DNA-binding winged helix-turn-helix (wHTH) protein
MDTANKLADAESAILRPTWGDVAACAPLPTRLRFDSFQVDLRSGELWKNGIRLRLQDQPFQVLRLLLDRHGEIVTREELKRALWPADTFVDFDDGLNTAVKKLRDLLGDSADRPRYIETIPRRGYRFMAVLDPYPLEAMPNIGEPAVPITRKGLTVVSWPSIAITLALVVAALAISAWRTHSRVGQVTVRAIAVLPLENLSRDPSQDYFAAGLTDALTTELARAVGPSVRVTSRTSAEEYRNKPLAQIVHDLNVDAVIEGSVIRSGNRARITAQLIQARTDKHLWAASYDRDLHDILSLQSQIAASVAHQVQITLTPRAQARLSAATTVDPQAYDLYQRGRYQAFSNSRQDLAATIGYLEQAIRLEPNMAPAHALLARAYTTEAFMLQPRTAELETKALDEVNRALTLDPDLAEAYLARGILDWTHRSGFPHERAIREFRHAIALDPNLAEAHHELGKVLLHIGLLESAEQELRTALRLEPTNMGVRYRIGIALLDQGRLPEATAWLEGTRTFTPELWSYQMAFALFQLGRKREAAALIWNYLRDNPRDEGGVGNAMQALLYADEGKAMLAERKIQAAIEKGKDFGHFHHAAYTIGGAYALMNRPQEAVHWLRTAADDGFPCYPLYQRDHSLDSIRMDPGFVQLMKDLKRRWEQYKAIS